MRFPDFRRLASSWWATIFMQTRLSRVAEGKSTLDTVSMSDSDGTEPGAEIDLTRLEQFGDVVIPPNGLNAAIWRKSDGGYAMALGQPTTRPDDGKQGDRGLYCSQEGTRIHLHGAKSAQPGAIVITQKNGARVTVDKDGQVLVDAAPGKDVIVNGGTEPVARKDDPVDDGTIESIVAGPTGAPGPCTVTLYFRPPQSVSLTLICSFAFVGTVTSPGTFSVPLSGLILDGAPRFKA